MQPPVLTSIRLRNYKGFRDHTVPLRTGVNILVGANNAGKTTVLGALRLITAMLPTARRKNPTAAGQFNGQTIRGWPVTATALEASAFAMENVRYDFRPDETSIEVVTSHRTRLVVAWSEQLAPSDSSPTPMYYVIPPPNTFMNCMNAARNTAPDIAVLPTFSPLEDREQLVQDDTLRRNYSSRRISRYFRNFLWRLEDGDWQEFKTFALVHTPEMIDFQVEHASETIENDLDLFFTEPETRHLREIVWAGDGIQIWLQILYHYWRQRSCPVVLLDEPDVYLHPDLQRRLARTIFPSPRQVILATHSTEILAEAEPGTAIWIDRSRRSAERLKADGSISLIGRRLGSGFELGVARALRSSTVLFVEGKDAPVLAQIARSLGFPELALAESYATVPLGGFSRRDLAAAFADTVVTLGGAIATVVLLDSDLRSDATIAKEVAWLTKSASVVHVWKRRELESYLLQAAAIAEVSGLSLKDAEVLLAEVIEANRAEALLTLQTTRLGEKLTGPTKKLHDRTILQNAQKEFEDLWSSWAGRLKLVDPKAVISTLNTELQLRSLSTVNSMSLAKNLESRDVPQEVFAFFQSFQDVRSGARSAFKR